MTVDSIDYVYVAVEVILGFFIVFGNSLVIASVYRFHHLQTRTNAFILNVALADLGVGLTMAYHIAFFLVENMDKRKFLCLTRYSIVLCFMGASLLSLTCIGIDRFCALTKPLEYVLLLNKRKIVIIICAIWILALFIGSWPYYWNRYQLHYNVIKQRNSTEKICKSQHVLGRGLVYTLFVLFVVCTFIIASIYMTIFCKMREQEIRVHPVGGSRLRSLSLTQSRPRALSFSNREFKTTKMVLTLESNTLDCVYIYKCGITDIVVECPNLTHLDATCCRSLKNVDLPNAPKLQSVYLCSCKKLNHTGVVEEIIKLPPVTSRKVILRPMQNYNHEDVEEVLFSENQKYGAILMRDHAKQPDINFSQRAWLRTAFYAMADAQRWLYYEMRKKDWLDHESGFKDMNRYSFPVQQSSQRKYPWGRDVAYYYGCCSDDPGSDWDIITDVAWFRGEPVQSELHSKDKKKFILKWSVDDLKQNLDGVADYVQGGVLPVFPALVSVVVLLCDLNRPTVCHDMYM